jgi:acyl dehydratase
MSGAPYFEDLAIGQIESSAPAVTLTDGIAAAHQAIVGDRLRLALDHECARAVTGEERPLAHPALVWDVAIGQSTLLTARVIANLFYRGLVLRRMPSIGDTLRTSVEVVALRPTSARAERPPSGLAALRVTTIDQQRRTVLDFWRCAMLPAREATALALPPQGSFDAIPEELPAAALRGAVAGWRFDAPPRADVSRAARARQHAEVARAHAPAAEIPDGRGMAGGERFEVHGGDLVSSATELARLTLNVAAAHHDAHAQPGGRRLVYGGHTIGIAAAQASRMLPAIATIVGWHSCEHLAPVYEGDTLRSSLEVERIEPLLAAQAPGNAGPASDERPGRAMPSTDATSAPALAHLRSRVHALRENERTDVLDWRFVAVLA